MTSVEITTPNSSFPALLPTGSSGSFPIKSSPSPEKVKKVALGVLLALCLISCAAIGTGASVLILITVGVTIASAIVIGTVALAILFREIKQDKIKKKSFFNNTCTPSEAILKELNAFPECAALIKEANDVIGRCKLPPLEIRFEKTKGGFPAEQDNNIVRIKPGQTAGNILGYALIELANLTQHEKFLTVHKKYIKGDYASAEEYARAMEFIEYHNCIRRNHITTKINKSFPRYFRHYMENEWENCSLKAIGFDKYYSKYLANHHKKYYRKYWTTNQPNVAKYQADLATRRADFLAKYQATA